jgi:hypothetical protein
LNHWLFDYFLHFLDDSTLNDSLYRLFNDLFYNFDYLNRLFDNSVDILYRLDWFLDNLLDLSYNLLFNNRNLPLKMNHLLYVLIYNLLDHNFSIDILDNFDRHFNNLFNLLDLDDFYRHLHDLFHLLDDNLLNGYLLGQRLSLTAKH